MHPAEAAAYVAACRHLAVAPNPADLAALAAVRSPQLRARVRTDAHAAALCAALLVAHDVAPHLVSRFLAVYEPQLAPPAPPTFTAPVAAAAATAAAVASTHPASAPTPLLLDLSDSPALTARGAAAALAALHLLRGRPSVELDLRRTGVTHLSLGAWHALLSADRAARRIRPLSYPTTSPSSSTSSEPPLVLGLALDESPIRSFDRFCLAALAPLRWLSMRRTALANPTRLADVVRALPALAAALFATDPACEATLAAARRAALGPPAAARHGESVEDEPRRADERESSQQPQHYAHPPHSAMPPPRAPKPEASSDHAAATDEQLHIPGAVHPAPAAHPLRNYLLAHAAPALRWLDGRPVHAGERAAARDALHTAFETAAAAPSLPALLRHRELGLSAPPRAAAKLRDPHPPRPKKRRRVVDYDARPANLLAALTAAGFPPVPRAPALATHAQVALALAAASSSASVPPSPALRHVRDAALALVQPALPPGSPPLPPPPLAARPPQPDVGLSEEAEIQPQPGSNARGAGAAQTAAQKRAGETPRGGLVEFCGATFERAVSTALIRRPGAPRTEFLHHAGDRPRQFEYSPANPAELVYGTELGRLVVLNQETGAVRGSCQVGGGVGGRLSGEVIPRSHSLDAALEHAQHPWPGDGTARGLHRESPAVFGLSWLNKRPDIFISGSNNGAIHVYNVEWMSDAARSGSMYACETFNGLTSIHVNADDSRFAVSGVSLDVGVFDLATGRRLETMHNCHGDMVNVIKFAHNNPYVLVTSSFDRTVKKWDLRESRPGGGRRPIFTTASRTDNMMACFSPDDSHLLVSAVDNEVRQFSAVDGRLVREFDIPKTGSRLNFTRSYYMNERDYIITGSSMESSVRVFNARTGAYLTQVDMDERDVDAGRGLLVQSLRANPSRAFNFSALLVSRDNPALDLIANVDLHTRA